MKFYSKIFLLFISISIFTEFSFGQKQVITGKVIDEEGKPVAYASIKFKGSGIGTWTMEDGSYRISIPNGYDTIVCTHVNYNKRSQKVDGNTIVNFVLAKQILSQSPIAVSGTHKYTAEEITILKNRYTAEELTILKNRNIEVTENDDRIFTKVEVYAEYVGGGNAFQKYLSNAIIYPDSATISNVKGIVQVGFIIGKDGLVKNATLLKGVNKFADNSVLQAIMKMPKWNPAIQNGRNVEQNREVSVSFDVKGIE